MTTRREIAGLSLETPRGWSDLSIVVFEEPGAVKAAPANIVLTSRPAREAESLHTHMWRRIFETSRMVTGFALLEFKERLMCGENAVTVRFRWQMPAGRVSQTVVAVRDPSGKIFTITISSMVGEESEPDDAHLEEVFDRVLRSAAFTSGTALPDESPGLASPPSGIAPRMPDAGMHGSPHARAAAEFDPWVGFPTPCDRARTK